MRINFSFLYLSPYWPFSLLWSREKRFAKGQISFKNYKTWHSAIKRFTWNYKNDCVLRSQRLSHAFEHDCMFVTLPCVLVPSIWWACNRVAEGSRSSCVCSRTFIKVKENFQRFAGYYQSFQMGWAMLKGRWKVYWFGIKQACVLSGLYRAECRFFSNDPWFLSQMNKYITVMR